MDFNLDDYTDSHQSDTGKVIGSFLIGAAVGVAVGILLAPGSGKDTIKQLTDKSGDWRNQLNTLLGEASKFVNKYVDSAKETANEKMGQ